MIFWPIDNLFFRPVESIKHYSSLVMTFGTMVLTTWSILWTLPRPCRYFTHSPFRPILMSSQASPLMTALETPRKTSKEFYSHRNLPQFQICIFVERSDSSASMPIGLIFMDITEKLNSLRQNTIGGGKLIPFSTTCALLKATRVSFNTIQILC